VFPYLNNRFKKSYLHTLISLTCVFVVNGCNATLYPSYTPLFDTHLSLNDNPDYINENHAIWDHELNDSRSFIELYNQIKFDATNFLSHLVTYWQNNDQKSLNKSIQLLEDLNKKS